MEKSDIHNGKKVSAEDILKDLPAWRENAKTVTEQERIDGLKKLCAETMELAAKFQNEIIKLKKSFSEKYAAIYEERKALLVKAKEDSSGIPENSDLRAFWMVTFKKSRCSPFLPEDEPILEHLIDVRVVLHVEPKLNFELQFEFEPNKYFSNTLLTKSYYIICAQDPENPLDFEGSEIYKCEACPINWKEADFDKTWLFDPRSPKFKSMCGTDLSFFNFFCPPTEPSKNDMSVEAKFIRAMLAGHYALGAYIKQRLVPRALLYFTGDLKDYDESIPHSSDEVEECVEDEDISSESEDSIPISDADEVE